MAKAIEPGPLAKSGTLTSTALLTAVTSLVIGFVSGLLAARRGTAAKSKRRNDELCECGAILQSSCTPEEIQRHKTGNRHRKNLEQLRKLSKVMVCEEVGEYRAAAKAFVTADDAVLEVGSHVGGTTKVLAALTSHVVGLDQQTQLVAQARINLPHIRFENFDAFDAGRILKIAESMPQKRFSKIFIDISGSRDLPTVCRLMDTYETALKPDLMVVKAQNVKRFLQKAELWINHPKCTGED